MDDGQGPPGGHPESDLFTTAFPYDPNANQAIQRTWQPERGAGQLFGAVLTLGCLAVTIITVQFAVDAGGFVRLLWLLVVLPAFAATAISAFMLLRLRSIRYLLEDDSLVISSVGTRIEIPYREIIDVVFRPRDVIEVEGYERFWPGFYDSLSRTSDGTWRSIATTPPHERARIVTTRGVIVAISPQRPVLFVEAFESARQRALQLAAPAWREADCDLPPTPSGLEGGAVALEPPDAGRIRRTPPALPRLPTLPLPVAYRIFRDRIVHGDPVASKLLAMSLLLLIAIVFIAAWKVDSVTQPLAVKWNPDGEPSWFVRPDGFWLIDGVWIYPVTTAAVIAVNAALATLAAVFGRMLEARLVLSTSVVVSAFLLLAMVRTTGLF